MVPAGTEVPPCFTEGLFFRCASHFVLSTARIAGCNENLLIKSPGLFRPGLRFIIRRPALSFPFVSEDNVQTPHK